MHHVTFKFFAFSFGLSLLDISKKAGRGRVFCWGNGGAVCTGSSVRLRDRELCGASGGAHRPGSAMFLLLAISWLRDGN